MREKRWREYCGYNADNLQKKIEKILIALDLTYERTKVRSSGTEMAMLGSDAQSVAFKIKQPGDLTIKIVEVTGDPILRFFAGITSDKVLLQNSSVIDFFPINQQTRAIAQKIINQLASDPQKKPWEFTDLVFRNAALLRLKIKRRWSSWLTAS